MRLNVQCRRSARSRADCRSRRQCRVRRDRETHPPVDAGSWCPRATALISMPNLQQKLSDVVNSTACRPSRRAAAVFHIRCYCRSKRSPWDPHRSCSRSGQSYPMPVPDRPSSYEMSSRVEFHHGGAASRQLRRGNRSRPLQYPHAIPRIDSDRGNLTEYQAVWNCRPRRVSLK
jgi:hypothetical protein